MNSVSNDAKIFLSDIGLYSLPVDPIVICKKLDIHYDEVPYEGFDGTLIAIGNSQLIGVNSEIIEPGRKAFTCAHELGHVFYDLDSIKERSFKCTRHDVGHGKSNNILIEIRANEFASEILLPRELFIKEISNKEPSWGLIKDLANKFGTSLHATANRFVSLSHHLCWLIVVKDGAIQRFTKAEHNQFIPQVKKAFKPPATDPGQFRETLADFWLYERRETKNKKLWFWPLPKNRYEECSILLWDRGNTLTSNFSIGDEFDDEYQRQDDDNGRNRW